LKPFIEFVNEELLDEAGGKLQDGKVGASMQGSETRGSKSWFVYGPNGKGQPSQHAHPNEKWAHHVEALHQLNRHLEDHQSGKHKLTDMESEKLHKEIKLNGKFRQMAEAHPEFNEGKAKALANAKLQKWDHAAKDIEGKKNLIPSHVAYQKNAEKAARTPHSYGGEAKPKDALSGDVKRDAPKIARALGPKGIPTHSTLGSNAMPSPPGEKHVVDKVKNRSLTNTPMHGQGKVPEKKPVGQGALKSAASVPTSKEVHHDAKSKTASGAASAARNAVANALSKNSALKVSITKKKPTSILNTPAPKEHTPRTVAGEKPASPVIKPAAGVEAAVKAHGGKITSLNQHPGIAAASNKDKAKDFAAYRDAKKISAARPQPRAKIKSGVGKEGAKALSALAAKSSVEVKRIEAPEKKASAPNIKLAHRDFSDKVSIEPRQPIAMPKPAPSPSAPKVDTTPKATSAAAHPNNASAPKPAAPAKKPRAPRKKMGDVVKK
jgi:hypothetical protein